MFLREPLQIFRNRKVLMLQLSVLVLESLNVLLRATQLLLLYV